MGKTRQSANLVSDNSIFADIANDRVGIGSTTQATQIDLNGDVRVVGILTVGYSSIILDGTENELKVGSGVTIHHTNGIQVGQNTLHSSGLDINSINVSGVLTATSFVGDGSGLTGAGSTVSDDTNTDATFYPLITTQTSGTVTSSNVSTTKLSFNPATGSLSATSFVGDGSGLTGAGSTVSDDTTTDATFYPLITTQTSGTVTSSKVSTTKLSFNPATGSLSVTDLNPSTISAGGTVGTASSILISTGSGIEWSSPDSLGGGGSISQGQMFFISARR